MRNCSCTSNPSFHLPGHFYAKQHTSMFTHVDDWCSGKVLWLVGSVQENAGSFANSLPKLNCERITIWSISTDSVYQTASSVRTVLWARPATSARACMS